jgi:hypothetical protein
MTDIDIIRMAKEAGGDDWGIFKDFMPEIEHFAKLVLAAERKACLKLFESYETFGEDYDSYYANKYAAMIRAREQE